MISSNLDLICCSGSDMTNFVAASFSTYDFASAMKLIEDNMDIAIMAGTQIIFAKKGNFTNF